MVLIWVVAKSRGSVLQELLMRSLILGFLMILLVLLMRMLENTCSRNSSGRQDFWGTELEFLWLIIYLTYIRLIGFFFLIMGRSLKMAHWRSFLRRVTLHPKTSVPSPPPDGVSSPPPPPIPSPRQSVNGNTSGFLNTGLESRQSTLNSWAGNIYGLTVRLLVW